MGSLVEARLGPLSLALGVRGPLGAWRRSLRLGSRRKQEQQEQIFGRQELRSRREVEFCSLSPGGEEGLPRGFQSSGHLCRDVRRLRR